MLKRAIKLTALSLLSLLAVIGLALTLALHTFSRLTDEALVASLSFRKLQSGEYLASLRLPNSCSDQQYVIQGDQWRLDADFIKWKPWANLLGLNAHYRLDRLSGRWSDIERQNNQPPTSYALHSDRIALLTKSTLANNPFWDSSYGSSTYLNIEPGQTVDVFRTQSGLIARSSPPQVSHNSEGELVLEINQNCGDSESFWQGLQGLIKQ